jgi:hypothetical protein
MRNNSLNWCVYNNITDEPIAVWEDYEGAYNFYMDHVDVEGCDDWELFPWEEILIPVNN